MNFKSRWNIKVLQVYFTFPVMSTHRIHHIEVLTDVDKSGTYNKTKSFVIHPEIHSDRCKFHPVSSFISRIITDSVVQGKRRRQASVYSEGHRKLLSKC